MKANRLSNLLLLSLTLLLFSAGNATAETYVSGVINTNTTWTLANSPYAEVNRYYLHFLASHTSD